MTTVTFDVETTTRNKGNPFTASNKMVCYSVQVGSADIDCVYYTDLEFIRPLRYALENADWVIGFNVKYDLHWARRYGVQPRHGVRVWDCQIAEFIKRGQQGSYPSLNECLTAYNLGQKDDKIAEYWKLGIETTDIPPHELEHYNKLDVALTYKLYEAQKASMTDKQIRLCTVMGLDLLVLEEMEWNGFKFDIEQCKERAVETAKELKTITDELLEYAPTPRINLDSGHQLSCMLYGGAFEITYQVGEEERVYKSGPRKGEAYKRAVWQTDVIECPQRFTPEKGSETKLKSKIGEKEYPIYATSEDVLKKLKRPSTAHKRIVELLLARAEKAKLMDTYYGKLPATLETMEWGEYLHGQYNQCVAATGRLSSSAPNMQNFSGDVDLLLVSRYG